jgi:hypothetical protein
MSTADSKPTANRSSGITRPASWKKLFFIKRRPHLLGIPPGLERPAPGALPDDQRRYNEQVERAGFVSETLLAKQGLPLTAELKNDLDALDEHLLTDFWKEDHEALRYQNMYYLYQWIFILGALATTIVAAAGVYIFESNPDAEILGQRSTELFQILTAVFSGFTTTVSILSATQSPQENWFKARTKAESLRSLYYLYLARRDPFNDRTHTQRTRELDRRVLDVLKPESK